MNTNYPKTIPHPWDKDEVLTRAYRLGWNHGHGIACHNVPRLGEKLWSEGLGRVTVDAENVREVHESACFTAESNSRSFSPFEFVAHEFNDQKDECVSEELWEAFEAGTTDAIRADLETYTDADYGIEETTDE